MLGLGLDRASVHTECLGFRASPKPALPNLQLTEKLLDLENENMMRVAELEKQLLQREKELESIKVPSNLGKEGHNHPWAPVLWDLAFLS